MSILTVNLLLNTVIFGVAARLYLMPRLHQFEARTVLIPILLLHAMRHLGLMFIAPGVTHGGLPKEFANPAAFGDLLTAVLAAIALAAVVRRTSSAKALVWVFNLVGTIDLIAAITLATVYDAAAYMDAAYWIPAFWVPALLVTHYVTFRLLAERWPRARAGSEERPGDRFAPLEHPVR
jgi:hypothetical protein